MDSNAYDDIYEEYIENILSISALSDKDHYIFYNFNIKDNVCYDEVYMLNQEGNKGELGNRNFNYNEDFYEKFIKELVVKFFKANTIDSKDVIYNDDDGTFRMITDNKDIFTISGLSEDQNEELLGLVNSKEEKENKEYVLTNNSGKVNYLILIFIAVLILLVLVLLVLS